MFFDDELTVGRIWYDVAVGRADVGVFFIGEAWVVREAGWLERARDRMILGVMIRWTSPRPGSYLLRNHRGPRTLGLQRSPFLMNGEANVRRGVLSVD